MQREGGADAERDSSKRVALLQALERRLENFERCLGRLRESHRLNRMSTRKRTRAQTPIPVTVKRERHLSTSAQENLATTSTAAANQRQPCGTAILFFARSTLPSYLNRGAFVTFTGASTGSENCTVTSISSPTP